MKNRISIIVLCCVLALLAIAAAAPSGVSFLKLLSNANGNGQSFTNISTLQATNGYFNVLSGPATNQFGSIVGSLSSNSWGVAGNTIPNSANQTNIIGIVNKGTFEATPLWFMTLGRMAMALDYPGFNSSGIYYRGSANLIVNPSDARNGVYANIIGGSGGVSGVGASVGSSILGGESNRIHFHQEFGSGAGYDNTIFGGFKNEITNSSYSAVGGYYAFAGHSGSFVWSDPSANESFSTTATNQFLIRATGGVGIGTNDPGTNAMMVVGNIDASSFTVNGETLVVSLGGGATNGILMLNGFGTNTTLRGSTSIDSLNGEAAYFKEMNGVTNQPITIGSENPDISAADSYSGIVFAHESTNITTSYGGIFGGSDNTIYFGLYSVILGGQENILGDQYLTVSQDAFNSVILGGTFNTNYGNSSAIISGTGNYISGTRSIAAGTQTRTEFDDTFVWSGWDTEVFSSTADNQFLIRASGGVGINTNNPGTNTLKIVGNVDASSFTINGEPLTMTIPGRVVHHGGQYDVEVSESGGTLQVNVPMNYPNTTITAPQTTIWRLTSLQSTNTIWSGFGWTNSVIADGILQERDSILMNVGTNAINLKFHTNFGDILWSGVPSIPTKIEPSQFMVFNCIRLTPGTNWITTYTTGTNSRISEF